MKKNILSIISLVFVITLSSCGTYSGYFADYSIVLSSVESPTDAKQQFGETRLVTYEDNDKSKHHFEDDYIDITWSVSAKKFTFDLKNKSKHTIKINWDDMCYVDINGQVSRVMHDGDRYTERNTSQPSSSIPKGAHLSDILLSSNNVISIYGVGNEHFLVPCYYKTAKEFNSKNGAKAIIGRNIMIMMPIIIENVQNEYTFKFNIDKLLNTVDEDDF